jgi:hypothetical protein
VLIHKSGIVGLLVASLSMYSLTAAALSPEEITVKNMTVEEAMAIIEEAEPPMVSRLQPKIYAPNGALAARSTGFAMPTAKPWTVIRRARRQVTRHVPGYTTK